MSFLENTIVTHTLYKQMAPKVVEFAILHDSSEIPANSKEVLGLYTCACVSNCNGGRIRLHKPSNVCQGRRVVVYCLVVFLNTNSDPLQPLTVNA